MTAFAEPWLIIGAKGMLGTDLTTALHEASVETVGLDIDEVDIQEPASVRRAVRLYKPGLIVNAAALTDVDGCETSAEAAFRVNAQGPENVAGVAASEGAFLVHISTDYVFDGSKRTPYTEADPISPIGVYGNSKAEGETRVRRVLPESHCIIRTQWLFGLNGKNFVEAILTAAETRDVLKVVNDQRGRPTYAADLAHALVRLCKKEVRGTVHVTNAGQTTWYDFAVAIIDRAGVRNVRVEPTSTKDLGRPAPRPPYSVLDTSRFVGIVGAPLRSWEEALDDYLIHRSPDRSTPL